MKEVISQVTVICKAVYVTAAYPSVGVHVSFTSQVLDDYKLPLVGVMSIFPLPWSTIQAGREESSDKTTAEKVPVVAQVVPSTAHCLMAGLRS